MNTFCLWLFYQPALSFPTRHPICLGSRSPLFIFITVNNPLGGWCCASSYQPVSRRDGESISLVPYPAAPSQSDQHALYRDMESRWAVNPKVRRGDHTFLMVSDFLTNPGFPADSCSVWVASGRMLVDIIVSHRWITEFTGNEFG